jgi:hypothetical protein
MAGVNREQGCRRLQILELEVGKQARYLRGGDAVIVEGLQEARWQEVDGIRRGLAEDALPLLAGMLQELAHGRFGGWNENSRPKAAVLTSDRQESIRRCDADPQRTGWSSHHSRQRRFDPKQNL